MKKNGLWTKNFSLITVSTVLSAIGGEAMNLPISLMVFEQTKSTFMASLIMICGMLPDIILPILIAPIIDRGTKKKWIVGLDALMALLFLVVGIFVLHHKFIYLLYVVFTLIIGTISVFYRLAYDAWYPDLIPIGFEQKGYAVSGTIYPTVTIVMAPLATFLYQTINIGYIFILVAFIGLIDVALETLITESKGEALDKITWKMYKEDIIQGFTFLKKEKGIRNIYTYMSITSGASFGISVVTQAFYQTQAWLSVTMLGFLKSSETVGRIFGGLLQYKKEIPVNKRYGFTKIVYTVYDLMDTFLLFMPYPAMLLNRFLCGALGSQSATIRATAVQSYLPQEMRARINALFGVIFAIGGILFQLLAGLLGLILPYRIVALLLGFMTFISMIFLIWIPKDDNKKIYEATRVEAELCDEEIVVINLE
ncbi:MAG: Major Facilitator Superfamily [Anaerocolumna sp.]|jgi:MFS family permease|nr:Major Facilitator Superfamily [Anaerocolumna sp.]